MAAGPVRTAAAWPNSKDDYELRDVIGVYLTLKHTLFNNESYFQKIPAAALAIMP